MTSTRPLTFALATILPVMLLGCPPDAKNVCAKVQERRSASGTTADVRADCMRRLDAIRDRSSGEYGMCSQCVMNATDDDRLAACREQCHGLEDLLPTAKAP